MKAFVMKKIGEVGFMDKPVPEPGPNDALIRPTKGLVCTSDMHTVHGAITPDWGSVAAQAGHSSQSGGPLGGWQFANARDGVFAEYFIVNEADANMAHIPEGVADEVAVYTADMMSTGFMAVENAQIPSGGTIAIFAQGPVGLMESKGDGIIKPLITF